LCPVGQFRFSPATGASYCQFCDAGKYCPGNDLMLPCVAGSWTAARDPVTACRPCNAAPGFFCPALCTNSSGVACAADATCLGASTTPKPPCSPGAACYRDPLLNNASCQIFGPRAASGQPSVMCLPCGAGSASATGASCVACPAGSTQPLTGQATCLGIATASATPRATPTSSATPYGPPSGGADEASGGSGGAFNASGAFAGGIVVVMATLAAVVFYRGSRRSAAAAEARSRAEAAATAAALAASGAEGRGDGAAHEGPKAGGAVYGYTYGAASAPPYAAQQTLYVVAADPPLAFPPRRGSQPGALQLREAREAARASELEREVAAARGAERRALAEARLAEQQLAALQLGEQARRDAAARRFFAEEEASRAQPPPDVPHSDV